MSIRLAYSVTEAAEVTGLSRRHLDRAIREGRLRTKTTKLNEKDEPVGKRVILARELEAYLEGLADA